MIITTIFRFSCKFLFNFLWYFFAIFILFCSICSIMIFEKSTVKHLTFHELSSCLMRLSRGFSTTQHLITIEAYNSLYNLYYGLWNYQRILNTESQVIHNKIVTWQSYLSSVTCILPTKVLHEPTPLLLYKLIICDSENYYCNNWPFNTQLSTQIHQMYN